MKNSKIITGKREKTLEDLVKNEAELELALEKFFKFLIEKNFDSISPISNAAFSAIMIFKSGKVFSGANVDPPEANLLKFPEHRNCAEKQAALCALDDNESLENLKYLFLYRRADRKRKHYAEMFLPCLTCNEDYITELVNNDGIFYLLLNDKEISDFIKGDKNLELKEIKIDTKKFFYCKISGNDLKNLKIESSLGSSHCEF